MIDPLLLHTVENWGYYLLPKSHPSSPGFCGLFIVVRELPTQLHFDPEFIELRFADQGDTAWTTLRLSTPIHGTRQILAGRITLCDRLDKRIEFFTFGATLTASYGDNEVVYAICSSAPVLEIIEDFDGAANQLATEMEVLSGHWQAEYGHKEESVVQFLTRIDPRTLYQMSLDRLLRRYETQVSLRIAHHGTYATLKEEREWLVANGLWQTIDPLQPAGISKN